MYNYLDRLQVALRDIGLVLNPAKCRLWGPRVQDRSDRGPHYPDGLLESHVVRSIPVVPFAPGEGLTTLGVPADVPGGTSHSERKWKTTVDQGKELLAALHRFPEA